MPQSVFKVHCGSQSYLEDNFCIVLTSVGLADAHRDRFLPLSYFSDLHYAEASLIERGTDESETYCRF